MTMDQPLNAVFFHRPDDRLWIDIHDLQRFAAVGGAAVSPHFPGNTAADKQRQGEK